MPTEHLKLRKGKDGYYRTSWIDDEGKPRQRSFGKQRAKAMKDFKAFYDKWQDDPTTRNPNARGALTIRQAWERYKEHADAYYKHADGTPTGEARKMGDAFAIVLDLYGDEPAAQFSSSKLEACQAEMVERDLSANTVNAKTRRIRAVFKWLAKREIVPVHTWHSLQTVGAVKANRSTTLADKVVTPRGNEPVKPAPEQHVWQTIEHLPASIAAMVKIQLHSGCRPQDVCHLRPLDIDRSGTVWIFTPSRHKTAWRGAKRTVYLGPKAQEALQPYLERAEKLDAYLFTPALAEQERNASRRDSYTPPDAAQGDYRDWPSYQKRRERQQAQAAKRARRFRPHWTTDTYGRAITDACDQHNIPRWSPGQLRHNAATRIRKEYGLEVA